MTRTVTPIAPAPTEEMVTAAPSRKPSSTVPPAAVRSPTKARRRCAQAMIPGRKIIASAVKNKATPSTIVMIREISGDGVPSAANSDSASTEAGGQPADDPPVDRALGAVHERTRGLRDGREEQVGADRGRRAEPEQQHEHW